MNFLKRALDAILGLFRKPQPAPQPLNESPLPPPRIPAATRRIALVEQLRGTLGNDCHEYGYNTARKSGRRTQDQAVLKALDALAESKARAMAESISEAALQNLLRRLKEQEEMGEQRVLDRDGAANKYNTAQHALAATPVSGAYPELSGLLQQMATVWLTMSLAPTCHDLLVGFDPQMKWIAGIAAGLGISIAMVHGMLPTSQPDIGVPRATASRHSGAMFAGILLGVGFLALRLSGARSYSDLLLAVALALMELGAIVLVERKAKPLFAEIEAWRERVNARALAEAHFAAAKQELDHRQSLVDQTDQAIADIEDTLERAHAVANSKTLVTIAVNAMRAGYAKGIAENAAALGGAA